MSKQNYFLLLELDENEIDQYVHDYERLERKMKEKQADWTKKLNHPSKGNDFRAKLEGLKGFENDMQDPDKRQEFAEEAKQLLAEKRAEAERKKYEKLDASIAILGKKGWLEEEEVQAMIHTFGLTKDEVLARCSLPIERRLSKPKQKKTVKVNTKKAREIAEACAKLGIESNHKSRIASLYDYLGLAPNSKTETLLEEADRRYKVISRRGKSASNNLEKKLQSYCVTIFQREREKYDQELSQLRLEKLDDYLKVATATKVLTQTVKEELIREAMEFGDLSEIEAREYIDTYCLNHGVEMESGKKGKSLYFKQCGFCGRINEASHTFCTSCRTSLHVTCPSCRNLASSSDQACGKCGFPLGDMANVNRLLERADRAFYRENFEDAKFYLSEVLSLWSNHPEATKKMQELERLEEETSRKLMKIKQAMEKKRYYEARSLLIRERKLVNSSQTLKSLEKECLERIHLAESFLKRALNATDEETAAGYYFKAYEVSTDCKEAKQMLAKWPPSLPTGLQVIPSSNSITLRWQPSPSKGAITYRLLRKKDSPSVHFNDGEILQESSDCMFTDYDAEGGYPYYYSIYTMRGSIVSNGSLSKGPFIRRADVKDITIHQENNAIELTWKKPRGATAVEVWRKENNAPMRRQDGELLEVVTGDRFVDQDVVYGQSYGYRLVVVYEGEKTLYSEGKTLQSKAMRIPKVYEKLTAVRKEDGVELYWEDSLDTLEIYYAYEPFLIEKGKPIPLEQVPSFPFKVEQIENNQAFIPIDLKKNVYFLPVTKNDDVAVYGEVIECKERPEVSNVRHEMKNNMLVLQWDWPENVQKAMIVYREDTFPLVPDDPKAIRRSVDKGAYDVLNGYTISSEERDYYFTIFTRYEEGDELVHSNGIHHLVVNSNSLELTYEIKVTGIFGKKIRLHISSEGPVTIPDLILVKRKGTVPTQKDQGTIIKRIPSQHMLKEVEIEVSNEHVEKDTYAKLFFVNDQNAEKFRLQTEAGKDSMKLW